MEIVGTILILLGGILLVVGGIWFLVVAFSESILWGLGCLFIPLVSLIFLVMHWQAAKKPFLFQLLGFALFMIGVLLNPHAMHR